MSFAEKIVKRRAKEWGMTEKEVREVGKRMSNYIKKEAEKIGKISSILVLKSFFVLEEVKKKRYNNSAKALALLKNKNTVIEKYANEIIDLHILRGWGSRRIAKYLQQKHNVSVSYSTIYKFLKNYKLEQGEEI